jgi:ERCC4-type nuclease
VGSQATSGCRILADAFEAESHVPDHLRRAGLDVRMTRLAVGDYALGSGVLVERKSVTDLHLSLVRGRLWSQVGGIRANARLPYLLVEGDDLDRGPVSPEAIRGACLAVLGQGVAIIRSRDAGDSALWLRLLAARVHGTRLSRDRPSYAQRLKPRDELVGEAMLAVVPGISTSGARALLEHFGSVTNVVAADEHDWLEVPGIGPRRAAALRSAIS